MSHQIKYVFKIPEPIHREQVFGFLGETIEDKENIWLTDLKTVNHDFFPVTKKNDITFSYSYKANLSYLFVELDKKYPDINWVCELWDEEIGLCYIAQRIDGQSSGWNVIINEDEFIENLETKSISSFLRDDYYR